MAVDIEAFSAAIGRLDREARRAMTGVSWHRGCPAALRDLRSVRLAYVGFDGETRRGTLIVHRRWADEVVSVLRRTQLSAREVVSAGR